MLRMSSFSGMDALSRSRSLRGVRLGPACCRGARLALEQPIERARGPRTLAAPVCQPLGVDDERACLTDGVVSAEVLQKATRRWAAMVRNHDAVKRPLFGAGA